MYGVFQNRLLNKIKDNKTYTEDVYILKSKTMYKHLLNYLIGMGNVGLSLIEATSGILARIASWQRAW